MKIKLFEEYNDPTYWQITKDEYDKVTDVSFQEAQECFVDFTDAELKAMNQFFDFKERIYSSAFVRLFDQPDQNLGTISKTSYYSFYSENLIINVHKMVDEWYYVKYYSKKIYDRSYYKCDQFDGLLDCLKMIKENED
jgi:hypothetical protein